MTGPIGGKVARKGQLEEFATRVKHGEMDCYARGCSRTATQVRTITRTFVVWTEVIDIPVCDEHTNYYF